jgi:hypothetical protein
MIKRRKEGRMEKKEKKKFKVAKKKSAQVGVLKQQLGFT